MRINCINRVYIELCSISLVHTKRWTMLILINAFGYNLIWNIESPHLFKLFFKSRIFQFLSPVYQCFSVYRSFYSSKNTANTIWLVLMTYQFHTVLEQLEKFHKEKWVCNASFRHLLVFCSLVRLRTLLMSNIH